MDRGVIQVGQYRSRTFHRCVVMPLLASELPEATLGDQPFTRSPLSSIRWRTRRSGRSIIPSDIRFQRFPVCSDAEHVLPGKPYNHAIATATTANTLAAIREQATIRSSTCEH